jgi:flagellar hook-associated protein 2
VAVTSFSGIASGIDTATIVKELVKLERLPIDRLESKKTALNTQSSKFTAIKDLLSKLQDSAKSMKLREDVLSSSATSSDDKAIGVTASGGATTGSYTLDVISLASSQRNHSEPLAARDQTNLLGWGELTIQVGEGEAVTVDVDENTTLDSLAADINRAGAGVTAGVLFTEGSYKLQISAKNTGAANVVTYGGDVADVLGLAEHVVREAKDAAFEIDDVPMTAATNTVTSAVPGVSFNLKAEAEGIAIEVTRDDTAIKAKLQGFVDAYNAAIKQVNSEFRYNGTAQLGGASLSGDATLRAIQTKLRGMVSAPAVGITGNYTTLGSIGIGTQSDGTLKIDDKIMSKVLADDPEAVSRLLVEEPGNSTINGVFSQFDDSLKEMLTGTNAPIGLRISSIAARVKQMTTQMDRMELQMDTYELNLSKQFTAMESVMARLQAQGNQMSSIMSSL